MGTALSVSVGIDVGLLLVSLAGIVLGVWLEITIGYVLEGLPDGVSLGKALSVSAGVSLAI